MQIPTSKWKISMNSNLTVSSFYFICLFELNPSLTLSHSLFLWVSAGKEKIDSRFDGWPPANSPSPSPPLSVLPSPPLSVPLLWLSLSSTWITQRPLGRPGQEGGLGGQTQKQSPLCLWMSPTSLPPGPLSSRESLSAVNKLLMRKQTSILC